MPKYANVYVTIQSHGLSAGARTHYVTANGVRNGIRLPVIRCCARRIANAHACCAGSGHFLPLPPSMAQPSPTFMNCHNNRAEIGFSRYFLGSRESLTRGRLGRGPWGQYHRYYVPLLGNGSKESLYTETPY